MIVVADASVALKWFFRTRADEADVGPALALLAGVAEGQISLLGPPHFVAEVAAVLARESPQTASTDLKDLLAIEPSSQVEPIDGRLRLSSARI